MRTSENAHTAEITEFAQQGVMEAATTGVVANEIEVV